MNKKSIARPYHLQSIIAAIVGLGLVIINTIRIFNIPITCDENGYRGIGQGDTYIGLAQDKFGSANNHILHSLFRKFFVDTFGNNLFTLRVDNLIAQIFFLVFTWLLCRYLFKNKWWALCSFTALNLVSPLIFNFWGLSRGYGLAMTCMTISIYYLLRYMAENRVQILSVSFVFSILSVYSNFGYINYFMVLCSIVLLQNLLFLKSVPGRRIIKELVVIVIASAVLALMITGPLQAVYRNGELKYMGSVSFMQDTVRSVIWAGLAIDNGPEGWHVYLIGRIVVVLTLLSGIFWLYTYTGKLRRKETIDIETQYGITFFLLPVGLTVSLIAQHVLFAVNYLSDRAALFFITSFMLQLIYLLYYIGKIRPAVSVISFAGLFIIIVYNFCAKINFDTTILWCFNSADLAVLHRMDNGMKDKPGKIKVGISWLSETAFQYDIEHHYPDRFYQASVIRDIATADSSFDYLYLNLDAFPKIPPGFHRDTECVGGTFILYKRNELLPAAK